MTDTTTVDYKYHIYELVDGKWRSWCKPDYDKETADIRVNFIRMYHPNRTFKLVTEKITTVREFSEETTEEKPSSKVIKEIK